MTSDSAETLALVAQAEQLQQQGALEAAKKLYMSAQGKQPDSPLPYFGLAEIAHLQKDQQKVHEYERKIIEAYRQAQLKAQDVLNELFEANRTRLARDLRKAVFKALGCSTGTADEDCKMASLLRRLVNFRAAFELYSRAIQKDAACQKARHGLAEVLHQIGQNEEALSEYRKAFIRDPSDITALWGERLYLPRVYETEEEIVKWRKRWHENIKLMLKEINLSTLHQVERAIAATQFHPNFMLAYQGDDIFEDQLLYGELLTRIAHARYAQYHLPRPKRKRKKDEKIRVGFVSGHFHFHSVFKTHAAWITKLDRSRFEIHTFFLDKIKDACTDEVERHSDYFIKGCKNLDEYIEKVAKANLDVLIYPDIGMHPYAQLMAALRLAPVQCNALGHPVTAGTKTVDYMLSSDLMEPENGQSQYSENLIRLPNTSSYYTFPMLHLATRPLSLPAKNPNKVVYLNLQNMQKLLPRHDDIYPKIALKVPNAEFYFIRFTHAGGVFKCLYQRLERAFASFGLDVTRYCFFQPSLTQEEFFGFLQFGDVVLDSLDWSGFNSTMEALASEKPVVTMPGASCRSRHSYAILKVLDAPELIANTKEEYIDIAARLSSPETRMQLSKKIQTNKPRLFEDMAPIKALEDFITESCT